MPSYDDKIKEKNNCSRCILPRGAADYDVQEIQAVQLSGCPGCPAVLAAVIFYFVLLFFC